MAVKADSKQEHRHSLDDVKGGYSFPATFRSNHLASSSKLFASFSWSQRLSGCCNC